MRRFNDEFDRPAIWSRTRQVAGVEPPDAHQEPGGLTGPSFWAVPRQSTERVPRRQLNLVLRAREGNWYFGGLVHGLRGGIRTPRRPRSFNCLAPGMWPAGGCPMTIWSQRRIDLIGVVWQQDLAVKEPPCAARTHGSRPARSVWTVVGTTGASRGIRAACFWLDYADGIEPLLLGSGDRNPKTSTSPSAVAVPATPATRCFRC